MLIVAALSEELQAFQGVNAVVTGPGKVQATLGLIRAIAEWTPSEVLVVGTAGNLHQHSPGVYEIGTAIQHDYTSLDAIVGGPVDPPTEITLSTSPFRIATGDSFVSHPAIAEGLSRWADFVDMESYAYAYVAQVMGVPIRILKAVTDNATASAAQDWRTSVAFASRQLWSVVKEAEWTGLRHPLR